VSGTILPGGRIGTVNISVAAASDPGGDGPRRPAVLRREVSRQGMTLS
jgi:hypothetical protein